MLSGKGWETESIDTRGRAPMRDADGSTLGITQVAFSLAQVCLFRIMREPQQSKAPPPATGAPPCLHVSPCASIVVALMTCSRALSPGGASSPAPFLLAGPAFVRVATEGTPHTVRTFRLPLRPIEHAHALHPCGSGADANLEHTS